jgi:hypothetical protein
MVGFELAFCVGFCIVSVSFFCFGDFCNLVVSLLECGWMDALVLVHGNVVVVWVLSLFMSALLLFLASTFRSISFAGHVSPMVELKSMVEWRSAEGLCNS